MPNITENLIDVNALSKQLCEHVIICDLVYTSKENFLGRSVRGYHPNANDFCLLTKSAAKAICEVQNSLNKIGLGLYVYDSYRPLRACKDFLEWLDTSPASEYELKRKEIHYPHLEKKELANLGYLAADVSDHCYADTIDLVLMDLKTKDILDMGACFDYFDTISHSTATAKELGEAAFNSRQILTNHMQNAGFIPYEKEFWHFKYKVREIENPMDFEMTGNLRGLGMESYREEKAV